MTLKKKYQSQPAAIVTYDYTDIASGVGYSIFYGGHMGEVTSSGSWLLSDNEFYSNDIVTKERTDSSGAWELVIDKDFDVTFNLPRVVRGDAIISIPSGMSQQATSTDEFRHDIFIYRVRDGAPTYLISGSSIVHKHTSAGAAETFSEIGTNELAIPETTFKKDDTLRLNVVMMQKGSPAAQPTVYGIAHDPKNRNDPRATAATGKVILDTTDTVLEFHVPFKLDI